MSKRIRELRQHVENKITDHERKRDALMRQREALIHDLAVKHVPIKAAPVPEPDLEEAEAAPVSHGAAGWLGVFQRLTVTREGASA